MRLQWSSHKPTWIHGNTRKLSWNISLDLSKWIHSFSVYMTKLIFIQEQNTRMTTRCLIIPARETPAILLLLWVLKKLEGKTVLHHISMKMVQQDRSIFLWISQMMMMMMKRRNSSLSKYHVNHFLSFINPLETGYCCDHAHMSE